MFVVQVVGEWDVSLVPTLPVTCLISGNQQNCLALRVECEQDPQLRPSGRTRTQLFNIAMARPAYSVYYWPSQLRSTFLKQLDGGDNPLE